MQTRYENWYLRETTEIELNNKHFHESARFFVHVLAAIIAVIAIVALSAAYSCAAYPYDSICEILVESGTYPNGDIRYNGGTASLVAVAEDQALLLTCKHVAIWPGKAVLINWAATGEEGLGKVIAVGRNQDIAMVICPRPKGLRPIPIARASKVESGRITNVGFPGVTGSLEWQTGLIKEVTRFELIYNCRPIPGMSGGVTFDQFGNQIGVITFYHKFRPSGGSSSGPEMIKFIKSVQRRYQPRVPVVWEPKPKKSDTPLPIASPIPQAFTPTNVLEMEIQDQIYGSRLPTSPLVKKYAPHLLELPPDINLNDNRPIMERAETRKSYTPQRQRKPRRLFRRSRR